MMLIEKMLSGGASHDMVIFIVCTRYSTAVPVETVTLPRVIIFNAEWTQSTVIFYTLYTHLMNMISVFQESYQLYLSRERTRQKV